MRKRLKNFQKTRCIYKQETTIFAPAKPKGKVNQKWGNVFTHT